MPTKYQKETTGRIFIVFEGKEYELQSCNVKKTEGKVRQNEENWEIVD